MMNKCEVPVKCQNCSQKTTTLATAWQRCSSDLESSSSPLVAPAPRAPLSGEARLEDEVDGFLKSAMLLDRGVNSGDDTLSKMATRPMAPVQHYVSPVLFSVTKCIKLVLN